MITERKQEFACRKAKKILRGVQVTARRTKPAACGEKNVQRMCKSTNAKSHVVVESNQAPNQIAVRGTRSQHQL